MNSHHTADPTCLLCEAKLAHAHSLLIVWFHKIKVLHRNVHISWSYRDKDSQEQAVRDGKSELHFPHSAHNKTDAEGQPCAHALDLFQLDEDGVARFAPLFYAKLAAECEDNKDPIRWGGTFKSIGDKDHFELIVGS